MKSKLKLLKLLLLVCLSITAVFFIASCDEGQEEQEQKPIIVERVVLDQETLTLEKLEDAVLTASLENLEGTVEWSSSISTVATVINGKVEALSAGQTTVTASVNGKEAYCYVTVTDNNRPLVIECNLPDNLGVVLGGDCLLTARVSYNGKEIKNPNLSYEIIGEEGVIKVDEPTGCIIGKKKGDVQLKVSASYKGIDAYKIISVNVSENLNVDANTSGVLLKTVGSQSETEFELSFTVYENNKKLSSDGFTVKYLDFDDEIIDVNENLVSAKKKGKTNITAIITTKNTNIDRTVIIPVEVALVEKDVSDTVSIPNVFWNSQEDYAISLSDVFNGEDVTGCTLVSVTDVTAKQELTVSLGKISINEIKSLELLGDRKWRVECEKFAYTVAVKIEKIDSGVVLKELLGTYHIGHNGKAADGYTNVKDVAWGNAFEVYKDGSDYKVKWQPMNLGGYKLTVTPESETFGKFETNSSGFGVYVGYYSIINGYYYLFINNHDQGVENIMCCYKDGAPELDEEGIMDKLSGTYTNENSSFTLDNTHVTDSVATNCAWVRKVLEGGTYQNENIPSDLKIWEIVARTETTGIILMRFASGWTVYTFEYVIDGDDVTLTMGNVTLTKTVE